MLMVDIQSHLVLILKVALEIENIHHFGQIHPITSNLKVMDISPIMDMKLSLEFHLLQLTFPKLINKNGKFIF